VDGAEKSTRFSTAAESIKQVQRNSPTGSHTSKPGHQACFLANSLRSQATAAPHRHDDFQAAARNPASTENRLSWLQTGRDTATIQRGEPYLATLSPLRQSA